MWVGLAHKKWFWLSMFAQFAEADKKDTAKHKHLLLIA
jgi:hypothetical protein